MDLLSHLECRKTGFSTPSQHLNSRIAEVSDRKTDRRIIGLRDEYELSCKVSTSFMANNAEYRDALRHARAFLTTALYSDFILELQTARMAVSNGKPEEALTALNKILAALNAAWG